MRHAILFAAALQVTTQVHAGDWPGWRGPNGNGVANGQDYPTAWSADDVTWKFELRGIGASTPAVSGESIFVTTTVEGKNLVTCLGIDGRKRWAQEIGTSIDGKQGKDGTGANPSPVVDGERVFVYFKSGDFACFSLSGDLQWETNVFARFAEVTSETLWWDLGTSPVLTRDAVVVTMMHSGPSYLAAFNRMNGKLLWKHDRVTDAPREAAQSYTTPIVTTNPAGREVIIVTGADYVTCHDAANGNELWRVGTLNPEHNEYFRSISSSVSADGIVIAPYARGGTLTAIRMGGSGDVTKSHVMWTNPDTAADVADADHRRRPHLCSARRQDGSWNGRLSGSADRTDDLVGTAGKAPHDISSITGSCRREAVCDAPGWHRICSGCCWGQIQGTGH